MSNSIVYVCYDLAPTCFGIVAFLREHTSRFHYNIQQYVIYNSMYICLEVNNALLVKIIIQIYITFLLIVII